MSFILINIMLSIMFISLFHPLSMGLILLFQTIMISLITGKMNLNFWYSYILFLILVGAMLILFIYMTSLASNEKFIINIKLMILTFTIMFVLFIAFFIPVDLMMNKEMIISSKSIFTSTSLTKYLNFPSNLIFIFMIIYLFLTLIAIVKITNFKKGPLRQMN